MDTWLLIITSFFSSQLTAIIGMGGGTLLISVMAEFLPIVALVPVHGVVQLASNASRTLFGWQHIEWVVFGPFLGGSILGAVIGSQFVTIVPPDFLAVFLGLFILFITWCPKVGKDIHIPGKYVWLGAVQTFLSLFVGIVGPLMSPFLLREGLSKDRVVVTQAILATTSHLLKVMTFGFLGFAFQPYIFMILGMVVAVTLGSYAGTYLREKVSEVWFRRLFKIVITLLACRMILKVVMY